MNAFSEYVRTNNTLVGVLCVLLATLGLSLKAIFIKLIYLQNPGIDAISILALRFVFALPYFLLLLFFVPAPADKVVFSNHYFAVFLLLGTVGFYLSAILDFSALAYIPASLERLILFLYPTFVVLITLFLRPNEITRLLIFSLMFSYLGVAAVFHEQSLVFTPGFIKGALLVLAAAFIFAAYTVGSVKYIKQFGAIRFTAYAMIASTVATLVHAMTVHGASFLIQSFSTYVLIVPMAIFSTVMPLILMAEGVKRVGASRASIMSTTGPIITITLAVILLDEVFGLMQAVGGVMIVLGVYFVAKSKPKTA